MTFTSGAFRQHLSFNKQLANPQLPQDHPRHLNKGHRISHCVDSPFLLQLYQSQILSSYEVFVMFNNLSTTKERSNVANAENLSTSLNLGVPVLGISKFPILLEGIAC